MEKVEVIRGKLPAGAIDDDHAEVNVSTPAGGHVVYRSTLRTGKRYARARVTVRIDRSFPDGSSSAARSSSAAAGSTRPASRSTTDVEGGTAAVQENGRRVTRTA